MNFCLVITKKIKGQKHKMSAGKQQYPRRVYRSRVKKIGLSYKNKGQI